MEKVRIRFEKTGNARFISHLDLMRTMCRAFRRAQIPMKYTEGFNPKPKMIFGNPLSLGYESLDEVCDMEIDVSGGLEEIRERLAAQLPAGLRPSKIYIRESKISDISFAKYDMTITTDAFDKKAVEQLLSREDITVIKKSKSGEKEANIAPLIKESSVREENGNIVITAVVAFSSSASLNPDHIAKALRRYISEDFEVQYRKTATLGADGKIFI